MSATAPNQTVFSIGYDFHFGAGNNGNVFSLINYRDQSRTQTFTYDALNRLTSAQNAGTDCTKTTVNGKTEYWGNSYGYDAWSNLTTKTPTKCSAENLNEAAWASNQLHTISGPDNTYDAAGNMVHDATTGLNYTYDAENRITGAGGYTYTYDADGNRVEKSNGSMGAIYWYMSPGIVAESDLTGALKSEYVFFDGERVARKDFPGNAVSYYFSDHLKTASVITDAVGNITEDEDYYPWGGELQFVNNDSNHYKFTGKERDGETGLDYFGARYYGNWLGRWMSPDWAAKPEAVPYSDLHDPQSLNLYSYVRNIPTSHADPEGHDVECYLRCKRAEQDRQMMTLFANVVVYTAVAYIAVRNFFSGEKQPPPPPPVTPSSNPTPGTQTGTQAGSQPKVEPYEVGTYGDLASRSKGDGLSIDHIPSNASNIARKEAELGRPLTDAEKAQVRDQGTAVAVPDASHRSGSPTYGGRNTPEQIQADAADPQAAAARDSQAMVKAAGQANKSAARAAAKKIVEKVGSQ
jgi:RHS repeat-associated protein